MTLSMTSAILSRLYISLQPGQCVLCNFDINIEFILKKITRIGCNKKNIKHFHLKISIFTAF